MKKFLAFIQFHLWYDMSSIFFHASVSYELQWLFSCKTGQLPFPHIDLSGSLCGWDEIIKMWCVIFHPEALQCVKEKKTQQRSNECEKEIL